MVSNIEDFESLWFLYQAEGLPKNISIEEYPTDRVSNINKKISISIKFPDGMRIAKTGISFTELKHLI